MRTAYQREREDIWMLQARKKGSSEFWSTTSLRYFRRKRDVQEYIDNDISEQNFDWLEYRPMRYMPVTHE